MCNKNANTVLVYKSIETANFHPHTHTTFKANAKPKLDGRVLTGQL